jgi:perosamine synthetase
VTRSTSIRISSPSFGPDEEHLVLEVLRNGQVAQGPMVERFEALCAEMAGARHAVAVSNGTVSLEAILEILGVGPGDEVITSPLTFVATLNAIARSGATARFADVTDDFVVDPGSVRALINSRTAAIMPVHLYGLMADMTALSSLAQTHGLALIEDAAQAHGASLRGRRAGSYGMGSFSFYATKNVTAGEGGVITTSNDSLADGLRVLRNQGMRGRYEYQKVGRNLRMTDIQAALAIPQLGRLSDINAQRAVNAELLSAGLSTLPGLKLPTVPADRTHVWHQYTLLLPDGRGRNHVVQQLAAAGIESGIYYPRLVWDYPPFRENASVVADESPTAAEVVLRCLSLPVHQYLSASDIEDICSACSRTLQAWPE